MSDPLIRAATEADIPAIREIGELAWTPVFEEYRRRLGDDLFALAFPAGVKAKPPELERFVRQAPERTVVTEIAGQVVAFATWYPVHGVAGLAEVSNNAVHPSYQCRGLARAQYRHLFDEMHRQGYTGVRVTTGLDDAHAPARRAYEAVGFAHDLPNVVYHRDL